MLSLEAKKIKTILGSHHKQFIYNVVCMQSCQRSICVFLAEREREREREREKGREREREKENAEGWSSWQVNNAISIK